jgi:hypothetical protein
MYFIQGSKIYFSQGYYRYLVYMLCLLLYDTFLPLIEIGRYQKGSSPIPEIMFDTQKIKVF